MGVWEKMHSGELYDPMDSAFEEEHSRFMELLWQYNHTLPGEQRKRDELLRRMCAQVGEGCFIEVPFRANWGRQVPAPGGQGVRQLQSDLGG